ncbi:carbohydrate ABC transporter permease [Paenibacillus thermotolerans]|uniref:carbohydrate ABC transporter permease n=1 Tax=Paenibacillus thermotolerans TaxID=3027807 RepID=UPI0023686FEF|nr:MULTISPECIES: carbohydrate ABC transporter permease [unclassified Paenibacillus]
MLRAVRKITLPQWLLLIALTCIGLFMFIPIVFLFNNAFKPLNELYLFPPTIFVQHPTTRNFESLFLQAASGAVPFTRYLFNSVVVSVSTLAAVILVSTMAGYVLSKHRFHFKSIVMGVIMISLMFVPEMVLIPRYLVVSGLGLKDTYFALILPFVASPVAVFLMKQFIDQIPDALLEAAKLDGATDMYIFTRIVIPLTAPAVATICIITFQAVYMDTTTSMYYITKNTMKTMAFYMTSFTVNIPGVAAASIGAAISLLLFLPNLILFLLFQRKMIQTMLHSGVK